MNSEDNSKIAALINDTVDQRKDEIVDFLRDLIRIPSITGEEERIQEFVAEHLNTPVDTLLELSQDSDMSYWVSGNPNTPVELLNKFSKDEHENIRSSVAVNPSTPAATLSILCCDENEDVRAAVAKNLKTPVAVLEKLSKDEAESVREAVKENSAYTS